MTYAAIRVKLEKEHGFVISVRQIENLADLFGALMSGAHLEDGTLIAEMKASGRMVLSIDAAKPLKDDDAVWFVRDVLSGNTLAAGTLRSSTAGDLRRFLRPVKEFARRHGIAIVGAISDGEKNIRKAIAKELPGVPHQLCQLHFVKNVAKPLQAKDSALRKKLKSRVRGLRQLERDVAAEVRDGNLSKKQGEILQSLSTSIQSVLRDSGKPPFRPAGLRLFARLEELRDALRAVKSGVGSQFIVDLIDLLSVLDDLKAEQEWLFIYYQDVLELGKILFAEAQTTTTAKRLLGELRSKWQAELDELQKDGDDNQAQQLLKGWLKLLDSYSPDLFHCFANPYIPATNNGMEKFIGDLKKLEQLIANNPRPATRFVKHAPTRALAFERKVLPGEDFLSSRRPEELKQAKAYLEVRKKKASIGYKARRDFAGTVNALLKQLTEDSPDPTMRTGEHSSRKSTS
jgi:hypothetical protein